MKLSIYEDLAEEQVEFSGCGLPGRDPEDKQEKTLSLCLLVSDPARDA
jgi:hypothetical protein